MSRSFWPRMVLLLPVTGAMAIFVWAFSLPVIVNARAVSIAGGDPFCIQVRSNPFLYRPIASRLDLTAFGMRVPFEGLGGSDEPQWTFHAVLVVEDRLYNWSHINMNFMPVSDDVALALGLQASCIPDQPTSVSVVEGS